MKYKTGDLIRINSFEWLKVQDRTEGGLVCFKRGKSDIVISSYNSNIFCGRIGEIVGIRIVGKSAKYVIKFSNNREYSFLEEWIECKIGLIKIKILKDED